MTTVAPTRPKTKTAARGSCDSVKPPRADEASIGGLPGKLVDFFTSLKLTIVCLAFGLILVFAGTMAQVDLGLYKAQNEFFRSFLVFWGPKSASWKIPVLPGGYLVGGVLLLNLIAAHARSFHFTRKKIGIWLIHSGLILLLLGQLLTDMLSRESMLRLREGETRNYSEREREAELAVIDTTDAGSDKVVAVPQRILSHQKEIVHSEIPFKIRVKDFFANSAVENRPADSLAPAAASRDIGAAALAKELPHTTSLDERDVPSAVIEILTPQGSIGTWLVSEFIAEPQTFSWDNRTYQVALRPRREYKPFSLQLLKFQHDVYAGTDIPKNFSSRVVLNRPDTGEKREVLVYMNNPLRYAGETYYQSGFDQDNRGTILQVVKNPSWLTPYLSCLLVGGGLVVQFLIHLLNFTKRTRVKGRVASGRGRETRDGRLEPHLVLPG
jgi:hypothetical protein